MLHQPTLIIGGGHKVQAISHHSEIFRIGIPGSSSRFRKPHGTVEGAVRTPDSLYVALFS